MSSLPTKSLWLEKTSPSHPKVERDISCDVLIVGGGVTGLLTAYQAIATGAAVCLVERNQIAQAETGHTTAHLTGLTDAKLSDLVKSFGESGAALAWFAGFAAIENIAEIIEKEGVECDFERLDGYWHESLIGKGDGAKEIRSEVELAQKLGFEMEYVESAPLVKRAAMRLRNQAILHPLRFLTALAERIVEQGGRIFEESEVTKVESERDDQPLVVEVNGYRITCGKLMIATNVPILGKTPLSSGMILQTKLIPRSSYVLSGQAPRGSLPEASFWDTTDPYFYLRIQRREDHDRVIFGGKDHKTGQVTDTETLYASLEQTLRGVIPNVQLDHRWSGQVIETSDALPFIGESTKNQFVATGFNGNGFTFAAIASLMFRDYLSGQTNPWQDLFSLERTILRSDLWEYLKSNWDYPYYMAVDRLKWPVRRSTSLDDDQGVVVNVGTEKIARARDSEGCMHEVSAICPHLGCVVHWNNGERTWDCPCHGSRFKPNGEVIAGPAEQPLADRSQLAAKASQKQ